MDRVGVEPTTSAKTDNFRHLIYVLFLHTQYLTTMYCNDVRRKKLGLINKSTLWFQKGNVAQGKRPNLQQSVF